MPETNLLREFIKEATAGDLQAFERIVVLHQSLVLRVAQRLLLNGEDAKDAAQEVFIRLHRSLGRFQQEKDFGPWLYRMTVNICHDIRRRRKQEISLDGAMEMFDLSPSAEETAVLREQRELVLAALGELTDREREVIVLRDLEGLSTAEVAEITGSLETTVRSQISTGRVKIRNHVAARLRRRSL
ncbi:MAG TPA: sigma-70 family RNA polymerase sigma factor [Bryobacteraceae bacterium]|nr:sigma-70 family RNA polymerase sigma factor [Bryobacteraceae bacterium]